MSKFTLKTTHAKEQLDYGERMGYDQLILAINKEDSTDGHYVSSMDLRRALEYLKKKVKKICFFPQFSTLHCILNCLYKTDYSGGDFGVPGSRHLAEGLPQQLPPPSSSTW